MSNLEILQRIVFSIIVSGTIGLEREYNSIWAGFRTFILVGLGSTIMSIFAQLIFLDFFNMSNMDPGRIPSYIVASIGFLGGGAILKLTNKIMGLTTAASIWVVAGVGMAIGYGYYYLSFISWISIIFTLYILKIIEHKYMANTKHFIYIDTYNIPLTVSLASSIVNKYKGDIVDINIYNKDNDIKSLQIIFMTKSKVDLKSLKASIVNYDFIKKVECY